MRYTRYFCQNEILVQLGGWQRFKQYCACGDTKNASPIYEILTCHSTFMTLMALNFSGRNDVNIHFSPHFYNLAVELK